MIELEILSVLKEKKLAGMKEIAGKIGKPEQDVKTVVSRMESDGLVKVLEVLGPPSVVMTAAGESWLLKKTANM